MNNNRTISFHKLREDLYSLLSDCKKEKIVEQRTKIFTSDICKISCFEETLENGILTAGEREFLENLNEQQKIELLQTSFDLEKNSQFDNPRLIRITSGFSLQNYTVKIPTAITQMKLRLLQLFLEPLPYKKSFRHSYGPGCKRRLDQMETDIISSIKSYPYGFKTKIQVTNSKHYLKTIKKYIPLQEDIIDNLVKSNNLTIRQLFPKTAGLNTIPAIEECLLLFWFTQLIKFTAVKDCMIYQYKDNLLVLCKSQEEVSKAIRRYRDVMPGFGIGFDYETLKLINSDDSFSFLGKLYVLENNEAKCKPNSGLFNCFLDCVYHIANSPVVPISEVVEQVNLIILCMNLYYRGIPENFCEDLFDALTIAFLNRYRDKSLSELQVLLFEIGIAGKRHFKPTQFGGMGFDELLLNDDFKKGRAKVENILAKNDGICPLCGRSIKKGEQVDSLCVGKTAWFVHRKCSDNIYEIIKNLKDYSGIKPFEKEQWHEILSNSGENLKHLYSAINSSWEYYPLYEYFRSQKKKLVRLSFNKMEEIIGFKLKKELKSYETITTYSNGDNLVIVDAWELAGYTIKPFKNPERFNGILTFERKEPSDNEIVNHPLMKTEANALVQKDLTQLIQTLIDSRK